MQGIRHTRRIALFAALSALLMLLPSCSTLRELSSIKDISITSCSIVSVTPRSFKSADALLAVGVHNPSIAFTISELTANVRKGDIVLAGLVGGPVAVERNSDNIYELPCTASLLDNMNLLKLVALVSSRNFDDYVVDIYADVMLANGMSRRLSFGEVPLKKLIEKARNSSSQ